MVPLSGIRIPWGGRSYRISMSLTDTWISKSEVVKLTGWSIRTVEWKAQQRKIRVQAAARASRNGRHVRLYALSSLPVEAQLKFLKQPLLSGPACTALALRSALNQSSLF